MATLKDIAHELNLSVPLVSKVLSGKMGTTNCSEATRRAILAKAGELDYHPNSRARALSLGRSGTIGVFIHSVGLPGSESLYEQLLKGITREANANELRLCLGFYENDGQFMETFGRVAKKEIDGLLVAGVQHPNLRRVYRELEEKGIPVITLFRDGAETAEDVNICCDEEEIGNLPTRHLLEKGCRHIGYIRSLDQRYRGYRNALAASGISVDTDFVYPAPDSLGMETGRNAVVHWLNRGVQLDGLVCTTDHQALGAITALLQQGTRVPEEVKVFGVDNSPLCAVCPVSISSVSAPTYEMGRQAVIRLLRRINRKPTSSSTHSPALELRASTGD